MSTREFLKALGGIVAWPASLIAKSHTEPEARAIKIVTHKLDGKRVFECPWCNKEVVLCPMTTMQHILSARLTKKDCADIEAYTQESLKRTTLAFSKHQSERDAWHHYETRTRQHMGTDT